MRGSLNAFGSSSIRPKLPVVYAKRGTPERFDLYFGQPTLRPARKTAKQFVSDAATIDRDDTTQIVRLFDEGLPALKEVGEVFTTPAFDRLIAPKPPSVKVGLSIKGNLVEISPLADEVPPDEVNDSIS